jgi:hypothetical protein
MDRQQTLLQMAQKMSAATASSDWNALAAINTLMAASLPAMAAQGPWSPAERAALAALRQLHRQAEHCAGLASAELAAKLAEMQANKEGWMAYAMTSGHEPSETTRGEAAVTGTTA